MKPILIIAMLAGVLGLAACGGTSSSDKTATAAAGVAVQPTVPAAVPTVCPSPTAVPPPAIAPAHCRQERSRTATPPASRRCRATSRRRPSGLRYIDEVVGTGASPQPTDTVTVNYTGWLTDGTKFDSSVDRCQPATFPLNRVIPGWTEGRRVDEGRRQAAADHPGGAGVRGAGRPPTIPGGATLIFDVELLSIN